MVPTCVLPRIFIVKVDISLLLDSRDEEEGKVAAIKASRESSRESIGAVEHETAPSPTRKLRRGYGEQAEGEKSPMATLIPAKRGAEEQPAAQPSIKRQAKWSPEEDTLIIELRGKGMKWEDISKRLPGRSAISCRLHYQNYLERRSEWDEDKKDKLARLYERFKQDMWSKIAEEMGIPWRAAEAMHWQIGEQEMARRAGVAPFILANPSTEPPSRSRRSSVPSSRSRREGSRPPTHRGLPSVSELTAGVPAYAPAPQPESPPSYTRTRSRTGSRSRR